MYYFFNIFVYIKINDMKRIKSNFDPDKIKMLLEYKGFGRVTDAELAEMWGRKKHSIADWKKSSPKIFDKIFATGYSFDKVIEIPNKELVRILKLHPANAYLWDEKRPKLLLDAIKFFNETGITFEEIYESK